jgi:UDP-glucose 4-epimerase
MKVLVTGGAGFVGSNLIKHLKENTDYEITSIDNYFTGKKENHIKGVKYLIGDAGIRIRHLDKQDIVFHLGEYSRVVPSFKDVEYLTQTNLYGTARVIEQCKQWDAKLIYSASSSKFGNNENLSPYSWVKAKKGERKTAVIPNNNTKELLDWEIKHNIRDWVENIIQNEQNRTT